MTNTEKVETGRRAAQIIESDEWRAAWDAYRSHLLTEIERSAANDIESVMHCKRLLTAAVAARLHLERLVSDGAVAIKEIEVFTKREQMQRKVRKWL
jgi:hypothetical protein